MRISVFTPTHRPDLLDRCAAEIRSVPGIEVEWVVVPNNGARVQRKDASVFYAPDGLKGVGALKRFAASKCSGDILVELDHDDKLLPGWQEVIAEAMAGEDNAFFYSSCFEFKPDGSDQLFSPSYGWEHGLHHGRKFNVPFPPTARSLCEIFYAPNHVRAWTRAAYDKAGGHNPDLFICDDQELLIKTYLSGASFLWYKLPLYTQYLQAKSTQFEVNGDIQKEQARLRNLHLPALVQEWCRRNALPMYDLGGAFGCPQGYTPVDRHENPGIVWDVAEKLLTFAEDNSVGCIRAHDFLEHVPPHRVVPLMNDIYRVLVPGGWLLSKTPSTDGRGAFQDPTHVSFWNENSFWYYTRQQQRQYVPEIKARFQAVRLDTDFPSSWHKENNISYVNACLSALKGQRQPGLQLC